MAGTLPSLDYIKKLFDIYDFIERTKPSRKRLLSHIFENGAYSDDPISERTLQRYIKRVNGEHCYYIGEADLVSDIPLLENLLYMGNLYKKAQGHLNVANGLYTELDASVSQYQQIITECLKAIHTGKVIEVQHRRFDREEPYNHSLIPYYVLERDKHWYLVAQRADNLEWRTFGLDRIIGPVVITDTPAEKQNPVPPKELFGNLLGVSLMGNESFLVKLKFSAAQANYERNYPWHHSFTELEANEDYSIISYQIIVNFEFECKIRSLGSAVEVVEPEWLRERTLQELNKSLMKYKKG